MEKSLNIAKTDQEKEEDLLEYIYRQDRQNRFLTASEYAIEEDLYAKEAARLVRVLKVFHMHLCILKTDNFDFAPFLYKA